MRKLILLICVLGISCTSVAQTNQISWANLGKLTPSQRIQVIEVTRQKHSGTFVSVSDSAISLRDATGLESIRRERVGSVKLLSGSHRLRNALIGAGVGAGAGAGITAAAWESQGFLGGKGDGAAVGAAIGGLGGLIVGAMLPSHKTVYRVNSH